MNVLVLNVGSSTLKFQLVRTDAERMTANTDEKLARGLIERIGGEAVYLFNLDGKPPIRGTAAIRDHRAAVDFVIKWMASAESGVAISSIAEIEAVGHRVVHGGERFQRSVLIDDEVLRGIEDTIDLAPLHNPHNLRGIQAARAALGPGIPQAAVFDTAFHHTLPEQAYLYAIPYQYYRRYRVRRYGFHGTSHRYVAHRWRTLTGTAREETRLVTLHLGNGCSACAIDGGNSIDTSMGFTPLEGLVMGTRSGDVDPAILDYVASKEGLSLAEEREHEDRRARLAIDIFCYRVRKYIGAYLAAMNGAEALIFAGGIGENSSAVRERICRGLEWMGIELDPSRNGETVGGREGRIDKDGSRLAVWVIPTDEELLIARDTVRVVTKMTSRF